MASPSSSTRALWTAFNALSGLIAPSPASEFTFTPKKTVMSTFKQTVIAMATYYVVIFGGRELMRSRPAFKLNTLFMAHNLGLTILSGGLLFLFLEQLIPTLWNQIILYYASTLQIKGISNVIIRNMKFYLAQEGDDLVALDTSTKVWIDHCGFYNAGITGDKDYYDGLLDITHACDFVTVSWCRFHDHWKGSLVGHSDSNAAEDAGKLHMTYHHSYSYNVNSRLPSLRFGSGHIYSSCFESCPTSGINSRMGAVVLVENNSFLDTKLAIVTDFDSDEARYATEKNNPFLGTTTTRITQTKALSVGYSYTMDAASTVCYITKSKAGVGIVG